MINVERGKGRKEKGESLMMTLGKLRQPKGVIFRYNNSFQAIGEPRLEIYHYPLGGNYRGGIGRERRGY